MKIHLVRHGQPDLTSAGKVSAVGFCRWVKYYKHSGITNDSYPPLSLEHKVRGYFSVSSAFPRAIDSAKRCLGKKPDLILKEINEFDISRFKLPFYMSINAWLFMSRLACFMGFSGKSESLKVGRERLESAVNIIEEKIKFEKQMVIFGHYFSNRYISRILVRRGWIKLSSNKGYWANIELMK